MTTATVIYCDDCPASSDTTPIHVEDGLCNPCRDDRRAAMDDGPDFRDFPYENNGDPAFCDRYEVHAAHTYDAVNRNVYACPGWTVEDAAALAAEEARPPCEHGLSAALCAGPGHYPADY